MRAIYKINHANYFLLLIIALFVNFLTINAQVTEDFTDGDFSTNPSWSGTTGKYIVNGTGQLQSNGSSSSADTLYLITSNTQIDSVEWQFYMHLDFNPTASTNYVKIYLTSDQQDLRDPINGYFLRIGETGSSDTLELWRQDGGTETKILTGKVPYGSSMDANIKVTRDHLGNWALYSDPLAGTAYVNEGSIVS